MKWYWAILITLAIVILVGTFPQQTAVNLAMLLTAISAIAIAAHSHSWGWGIFVLFLWPIAFPCYLIATGAEASGQESGRREAAADQEAQPGQSRIFTPEFPHEETPNREPARGAVLGLLIAVGLIIALVVLAVVLTGGYRG